MLYKRIEISILLLISSAVLWFTTIINLFPYKVDASDFLGLTSHLPLTYWIGLLLLTLCFVLIYFGRTQREGFHIFSLIMLSLYLFAIPLATLESPSHHSYRNLSELKEIVISGHINPEVSSGPVTLYYSWPALHFIGAFLINILGIEWINVGQLLKYWELVWIIAVVLITFCLGKELESQRNRYFIIPLLLVSSFWVPQYHFSPQSIAYIYFLLFFILIPYETKSKFILGLIIYVSLTLTHCLTSFVVLIILLISFYKMRSRIPFLISSGVFVAWNLFPANSSFSFGISNILKETFSLGQLHFLTASTKVLPATEQRSIVNMFRFFIIAILLIYGVLAIIFVIKKKQIKQNNNLLFFSLLFLSIFAMNSISYSIEGFERYFIFWLVPLICVITLSYTLRSKALLLLILILISLHVPAHYGSESFDMTRKMDLIGSRFFAFEAYPQQYYYDFPFYIWYYEEEWSVIPREESEIAYYKSPIEIITRSIRSKYIIDSEQFDNAARFFIGANPIRIWIKQNRVNLAYNNAHFWIYVSQA
ncbi:MAG: hypothetical protein QXF82_08375 [Nitrososphaeria archaeon]